MSDLASLENDKKEYQEQACYTNHLPSLWGWELSHR